MTLNCKVGDLAIIVSDGQGGASNAIGLIVEVVESARCRLGPGWKVKMQNTRSIEIRPGKTIRSDWFLAEDRHLRPITGLPVDEEITNEVTA